MTTANLNLPEWAASQEQPHVTHNEALHLLDAIAQLSVISNALDTPPGSPAAGDCYIVAATATGAWLGWEDSIAAYINGAWVRIIPKTGWVAYVESTSGHIKYDAGWSALIKEAPVDGTAYARQDGVWVVVSASGGAYDFGIAFGGTPTSSEVMGRLSLPRETTCPADFTGSAGHVGANPTAAFAIDVQDDGISIGTISIATDGSFTFATTGGLELVIAAGSLITFVAPSSVDATIVDINATMIGNV